MESKDTTKSRDMYPYLYIGGKHLPRELIFVVRLWAEATGVPLYQFVSQMIIDGLVQFLERHGKEVPVNLRQMSGRL